MENKVETQFDRYVNDALQLCTLGQQEDRTGKAILIVKYLYKFHEEGYINDDMIITMKELDIVVLEDITRLYCDIRFFLDPLFKTITIKYTPLGQPDSNMNTIEFVDWFIKFFYYLESIELAETFINNYYYNITDEIKEVFEYKFVSFPVDVMNRKFMFIDLVVDII
jgi:hypothetical protein